MADIINLRQRRKQADRRRRQAEADENRIRHGQPASQRKSTRAAKERAARMLDGKKRERPDTGDDGKG